MLTRSDFVTFQKLETYKQLDNAFRKQGILMVWTTNAANASESINASTNDLVDYLIRSTCSDCHFR